MDMRSINACKLPVLQLSFLRKSLTNVCLQMLLGYYSKRAWRILPAYYVALLINAAVKVWPQTLSNASEEAGRVRAYFDLGQKGSRCESAVHGDWSACRTRFSCLARVACCNAGS